MEIEDLNFSEQDCRDLLLELVPRLKRFTSAEGGEGKAYFIGDELIVKQYTDIEDWKTFDKVFDLYCEEMRQFADAGFKVAKPYAWTRFPNIEHYTKGQPNKFNYYILEEQVHGRELYFGYIADAYKLASDLCSKKEFYEAIKPKGDKALFYEIVKRYFEDYVVMNECLLSMSDDELTKFLLDAYQMYTSGKVIYPDMFPHNILINDNKSIKMIDPHFEAEGKEINVGFMRSDFVTDVVNLFIYNAFVNHPKRTLREYKGFDFSQFQSFTDKNKKLSKSAILRVLSLMNSCCDRPKVVSGRTGNMVLASLDMVFDNADKFEILDAISFE